MEPPSLPPNVHGDLHGTLRVEVLSSPLPSDPISVHFWGLKDSCPVPAEFPIRADSPHFFAYLSDMGELKFSFSSGASAVVALLPFLRGAKDGVLKIRGKFPVLNKLKLDVGKLEVAVSYFPTVVHDTRATSVRGISSASGRSAGNERISESLKMKVMQLLDKSKQLSQPEDCRQVNDSVIHNQPLGTPPKVKGYVETPAMGEYQSLVPIAQVQGEVMRADPPLDMLKGKAFALVDLQDPLWDGEVPSGSTKNSVRSTPSIVPALLAPRLSSTITTTWTLRTAGASPTLRFSPIGESLARGKFSGGKSQKLVLRVAPIGPGPSGEFSFSSILLKYAELEDAVALNFVRLPEALEFALIERRGTTLATCRTTIKSPGINKPGIIELPVEFKSPGAPASVFGRMMFALVPDVNAWVTVRPLCSTMTGSEYVRLRVVGKPVIESRVTRDVRFPIHQVRLRPDCQGVLEVVVEIWKDANLAKLMSLGRTTLALTEGAGVDVRCNPVSVTGSGISYDLRVQLISESEALAPVSPCFQTNKDPALTVSTDLAATKASNAYEIVETVEQLYTMPLEERSISAFPDLPAHIPVLDEPLDETMEALIPHAGSAPRTPVSIVQDHSWVASPPRLIAPAPMSAGPTSPFVRSVATIERSVESLVAEGAPLSAEYKAPDSPFERVVAARLAALAETLEDLGSNEIRDFHRRNMEILDAGIRQLTGDSEPESSVSAPPTVDPPQTLVQGSVEQAVSSSPRWSDYDELDASNLLSRLRQALAHLPFAAQDVDSIPSSELVDEHVGITEEVERITEQVTCPGEMLLESAPSSPDEVRIRPATPETPIKVALVTEPRAKLELVQSEVVAFNEIVPVVSSPGTRVFSLTEADESIIVEDVLELQPLREWRSEPSRNERVRITASLSSTGRHTQIRHDQDAVVSRRPEIPCFEERQFLRRQFRDRKRVSKILIGRDSSSDELSD